MDNIRFQRSLTLPNNVDDVPQLSEFVEIACEELGIDMSMTMSIELAIEEAVVNVMEYAYPEGTEGQVSIEILADNAQVVFVITDSGIPFDPTAKEEVDTTLSANERSIGGLGIHLIRQIMDHITYERVDNKNILTLTKVLN